jgi:hypothetical protein
MDFRTSKVCFAQEIAHTVVSDRIGLYAMNICHSWSELMGARNVEIFNLVEGRRIRGIERNREMEEMWQSSA